MAIYCISDLHLSFGTDKPMNIFPGWDNYEEKISANWKKYIKDNDYVILPGDLSWALKLNDIYKDFEFLNNLPGTKILLKGNHDLWWGTNSKNQNYIKENKFDTIKFIFNNSYLINEYSICGTRGWLYDSNDPDNKKIITREAGRLELSIKAALSYEGTTPLVFLHYPPVWNGFICDEIIEVLNKYNIKEVWHGHIHGVGRNYSTYNYNDIVFHLISADTLEFKPYLIKK